MEPKESENIGYEECPFCDRIFCFKTGLVKQWEIQAYEDMKRRHMREAHGKVWVRKGNRGKWYDITYVEEHFQAKE